MAIMGIRPKKFGDDELRRMIAERLERIRQAIISRLKFIGENFVRNARSTNTYKDHTGNLRSSIGYIILEDGEQIIENFQSFPAKDPNARSDKQGAQVARELLSQLKQSFPKGLVLIGVAGMDYAAAVESRGYDVITASSIQAETDLRNAIERLKGKIANGI